jgi:MFS family permease
MSRHVWERDLKLLWTGSAVAQFGAVGAATATPLLALSLDGSPISAGWASAAGALPGLLFQLPAGWLADRANRSLIMYFSQLVRVLSALVLVLVLWLAGGPPWLLVAAVIVAGTCAVFYGIAENAAVRDVVYGTGDIRESRRDDADHPESAMASYEARGHIAQVVGRPAGGFLFGVWHLLPFVADAVTTLLSVFMMRRIYGIGRWWRLASPIRLFMPSVPRASLWEGRIAEASGSGPCKGKREIRRSLSLLAGDRFLWTVIGVCAIANFFFQTVVLLLIFAAKQRGISGSLTGLFLSASGVGGMLGAFAAPRLLRKRSPQTILMWCVWSWLLLVLVVALVNHPLIGLLAWGGCSYMGAHVNVALEVHKAAEIGRELQGRVTGIIGFLTGGAVPLGALCGGYLVEELEPHAAAWWVTLVMFVLAVVVTSMRLVPEREATADADVSMTEVNTSAADAEDILGGAEVPATVPVLATPSVPMPVGDMSGTVSDHDVVESQDRGRLLRLDHGS